MSMDRRQFLASLGALALVGPSVVEAWDKSGYIAGETFYLRETFVVDAPSGVHIRNCTFVAVGDWRGPLIELKSGGNMLDCIHLVDRRVKRWIMEEPAILISGEQQPVRFPNELASEADKGDE